MRPLREVRLWVAFVAAVAAGCTEHPTTALPPENPSQSAVAADGSKAVQYVILMKANSVPGNLAARIEAAGGRLVRTLPQVGIAIAAAADPAFADAMEADNRVHSVGLDPAFTLPSLTEGGASLDGFVQPNTGPTPADDLFNIGLVWGVERVHAPAAWAAGHTGSHNTVVAIIDTGIASNHPDLAPNLVFNACFTSAGSHTGTWVPGAPCNPYPSLSFHGTHVAGTVGAAFGGGRVIGVAPGVGLANYNTFEIIPDCGVCTFSSARWAAMIDAALRGFDVVNMSLGGLGLFGPGRNNPGLATFRAAESRVQSFVTRAGTTIVAASGNNGVDLTGPFVHLPSDAHGALSVGGTGIRPNPRFQPGVSFDVLAFYSNFGAPMDVAAPGGDCGLDEHCGEGVPANWFEFLVLSSSVAPGALCAQTQSCPVGYSWSGGTSMAAPHVAGIAGLVKDANPRLNPQQVVSIIRRTAERVGHRHEFGHGIPPAAAAAAAK